MSWKIAPKGTVLKLGSTSKVHRTFFYPAHPPVKVGHCQALNNEIPGSTSRVFFCLNSSEMTYLNMECDKFVWNKFEQPKAGPKGGVQDARSNVGHCQALI